MAFLADMGVAYPTQKFVISHICDCVAYLAATCALNSEIFAINLFLRIALKDNFAK